MLTGLMRNVIAARAGDFLRETCTIEREVVTHGEYGEAVRNRVTVAADVPCRLARPDQRRRLQIAAADGREDAREEYRLVIPLDAEALQVKDRVTVNGRGFRVTQVETALTDLPFQQAVISSGEAGGG